MNDAWGAITTLEITDAITRGFADDGITTPTEIQTLAVDPILRGENVVVESGTGTGKTLAYLLPLLQRLRDEPDLKAIVLSPSPELAMQTLRVADRYGDESIRTAAGIAGINPRHKRAKVQKGTRLVVGTPGRVLELIAQRKLKGIRIVVLDEPDPILGGEHARHLGEVLSRPDPPLQIIVVGATMGPGAETLIADRLGANVVRAHASEQPLREQIDHHVIAVRDGEAKDVLLARLIEQQRCHQAILFVNRSPLIGHLYRYLVDHRLDPVSLSPDRSKQDNKRALQAFSNRSARLLITSDRTARGLDIPDVEWVFHYDFPHSAQAYLHRAGRTGRAGRRGRSVVLCLPKERPFLKRYARELGLTFEPFEAM